MKWYTLVVVLLIPLGVIALIMSPMIAALAGAPDSGEGFSAVLGVLAMFGLPQYLVFAPVLAFMTRGRSGVRLKRLMLWAPVLFFPFLIAPIVVTQHSFGDAIEAGGVIGSIGLVIGYVCVAIAAVLWMLMEPQAGTTQG